MVDNVKSGMTEPGRTSLQVPAVLETIRKRSLLGLNELLKSMFDRLNITLHEWSKTLPPAEQQPYLDIMTVMRSRRPDMEGRFAATLITSFSALLRVHDAKSAQGGFGATDYSTLSLVGEDEMDVSVAIDSMVARARLEFAPQLGLLRRRFAHLLPKIEMTERSLPLDPGAIADAFNDAIKLLTDRSVIEKLLILRVFQEQVLEDMGEVLNEANQLFMDAGILPDLKVAMAARKESRTKPDPKKAAEAAGSPESTKGGTEEAFSYLQNMLSMGRGLAESGQRVAGAQYHGGHYVGGGGIGVLPAEVVGGSVAAVPLVPLNIAPNAVVQTVATPELVALLSQIQQMQPMARLAEDASSPSVGEVRGSIREGLRSDEVAVETVRQADEDVINLVSMLFDFILDDDDLPTAMKALIGRLQIPILKVAILDKSFFNAETHPARRLLNALAKAGIGWSSREQGGDALYGKIEEVVFRILNEFIDDLGIFDELLEEFTAFHEQQQKREETVDQRTRDSEEGKARAELARAMVQQTLNRRLSGRQLPLVVVKLMQEAWRNVLYIHCLKEGTESEAWKQAVKVVDALIWSVQPQPGPAWQARLKDVAPKLSNSLKKGLAAVNYDPLTTETWLRELVQVHMGMLHGQETRTVSVVDASAAPVKTPGQMEVKEVTTENSAAVQSVVLPEAGDIQPAPATLPSDNEFVLIVSRLNVGSWVEFLSDEKTDRHKLVARIRSLDKLIFANRRGIKVAEMTGARLAMDMNLGSARLVEEGAFMDRALESVIGNLRHLSETTKTA